MLIDFRESGRKGEKHQCEGEIRLAYCMHPNQGPNPRSVPWLGIEPSPVWFMGWCSNQLIYIGQGENILHAVLYNSYKLLRKTSRGKKNIVILQMQNVKFNYIKRSLRIYY